MLTLNMALRLRVPLCADSCTAPTLTGRGLITSDSCTPLGTLLIIRSMRSPQVLEYASGEEMLQRDMTHEHHGMREDKFIYLFIVTLLSLLNMRKSEVTVWLEFTTRGFFVVPARYSVTLISQKKFIRKSNQEKDTSAARTRHCHT